MDIILGDDKFFMGVSVAEGISVAQSSPNKEKAVEFIKYLLSDEIQDTINFGKSCVPANKDAYYNELSNMYFAFSDMSESEDKKSGALKRLIDSRMILDVSGSALYDIIMNEVHEYYYNDSTEEQTADLILKKLQLYFSENGLGIKIINK